MKYRMKDWIRNEKTKELSKYNVSWIAPTFEEENIVKETAKAVQVTIEVSHYGISESFYKIWIPKSQIITEEEYKEEAKEIAERQNDYQENKKALQEWAKETLGTRANASEKTIVKKAVAQGVKVDENLLSYWGKQELEKVIA